MGEFDDVNEDEISGDFFTLVNQVQFNELEAVEKQREQEREINRELQSRHDAAAMTLIQVAGLKSQKEIDQLLHEKNQADIKRQEADEKKRKDAEHARLIDQFPPPDLSD